MDYFGLESLDALPDASILFDLDSQEEASQLFRDNLDLFVKSWKSLWRHHLRVEEKSRFFGKIYKK